MRTLHPPRRPPGAPVRRGGWIALIPLLLAGCISERREEALGGRIAGEVNGTVPLVRDAPVNNYVTDLGRLIASRSDRPDLTYHFYVVDTDGVNAFALPGGHIYINRGLIERTANVSELAGILAHEIGHVSARHGVKALQRELRTRSMSRFMYETLLGRGPLLSQEAVDVGGTLWAAAHSRADEQEADRLAVKFLVRTGVDPRGMLTLFEGFRREELAHPTGAVSGWFSTHPSSAERLRLTDREIRRDLLDAHGELAVQVPSYRAFMRRLRSLPPPESEARYPTLIPEARPEPSHGVLLHVGR